MRFTIITVTYNAAEWLERTILSVLSQSYADMEYIIIDGKSADGTVDIIRQYEAGISYWTSEPDSGIYDAMNKGLRHATGDYVWFLNAGDTLPSADLVQAIAQRAAWRKRQPDIIYGDTAIVDKDGKVLGMRHLRPPKELTWKKFAWGMLVCHQAFIARRAIAPEYDLSYPLCSDYDWCIRTMQNARVFLNTQLVLCHFLEAGISTRRRKASLRERYDIMCKYYGTFATGMRHLWFALRYLLSPKS